LLTRSLRIPLGVLQRAALGLATLAGAVALVQGLLWLAPGDAIDVLPNAEDVRPVLEREWGLDKPIVVRWLLFLWRALHLDLGTSLTYRPGAPVVEVIAVPAVRTFCWVSAGMVLSLGIAVAIARFTAGRPSALRRLLQLFSPVPLFLLAHFAINGLNAAAFDLMNRGFISRPGWFALPDTDSWLRTALAISLLALGSGALTDLHGQVEDAFVQVRGSGYVDAARARGEPIGPHVAWNLVPMLATLVCSRVAFFVGGTVVLEKVLLLNGVGAVLWQAAQLRDYNVALGITVVLAAVVVSVRVAGDLGKLALDPRVGRER
jgi:peptide/nickel transport system permease protein